jgi:hypothetical protein
MRLLLYGLAIRARACRMWKEMCDLEVVPRHHPLVLDFSFVPGFTSVIPPWCNYSVTRTVEVSLLCDGPPLPVPSLVGPRISCSPAITHVKPARPKQARQTRMDSSVLRSLPILPPRVFLCIFYATRLLRLMRLISAKSPKNRWPMMA